MPLPKWNRKPFISPVSSGASKGVTGMVPPPQPPPMPGAVPPVQPGMGQATAVQMNPAQARVRPAMGRPANRMP